MFMLTGTVLEVQDMMRIMMMMMLMMMIDPHSLLDLHSYCVIY